jgi:threonine aldolase
MESRRNFTSDNVTAMAPEVLAAIMAANTDVAASYGSDTYTGRLQEILFRVFEREIAVFPVATGTAANALALSQLTPPFGAIYCYEAAHVMTDECGAPELYTGGAKLIGLPGVSGRIKAKQVADAIAYAREMGVHHVRPGCVSITQATEWGAIYRPSEIKAIADVVHANGMHLHMDGARFANALVTLDCSPAEATWKLGVDALSLGATKNGAMSAEAVVFFDPALARDFEYRRKRAGHLWSKLRFMSCQLIACFEADLWMRNAQHANAMTLRLAEGLQQIEGVRLIHPAEANELFVQMPESMVRDLESAGFGFYRWALCDVPAPSVAIRLVTAFDTNEADVDAFVAHAARGKVNG